jgi:porin
MRCPFFAATLGLLLVTGTASAFAQAQTNSLGQNYVATRVFQLALPQGHLLGDWGGLLPQLEAAGIVPTLTLVTDFAANPIGGRSQGVTAPSSLAASLTFDLDKIAGLKDASLLVTGSERWGRSLSADNIGNIFATQQIYGYQTYRLIDFSYQQKLFDDRLEIRIGRFAALDDFLVSAYSCLFMQLGFCGNPAAILFDSPGVTGYAGTWAAAAKVNLTQRAYLQAGVYNGDPRVRDNDQHGVDLSLNGPAFAMVEVGYQINGLPGDNSQLLGNYKLGAWYDAARLTNFNSSVMIPGTPAGGLFSTLGSSGVYGIFDQVLVPFGSPGSNRGLGVFGAVICGLDPQVQQMPFFFNAGIEARGIFESRPVDALALGVVYGQFSNDLRQAQQAEQLLNPAVGIQKYETAIELTYRAYFDKSAIFLQPDLQYIFRPGGTGQIRDALVVGLQAGINF